MDKLYNGFMTCPDCKSQSVVTMYQLQKDGDVNDYLKFHCECIQENDNQINQKLPEKKSFPRELLAGLIETSDLQTIFNSLLTQDSDLLNEMQVMIEEILEYRERN